MPFPNRATQFKPGQSGNPSGLPKGTKNLSTHIQNILNDETFETTVLDSKTGVATFKGAPIKAIIEAAVIKAVHGDEKAREWLAKYGYGTKVTIQTPQAEAEEWFRSIDEQEQELANYGAKKLGRGTSEQDVATPASIQDKE